MNQTTLTGNNNSQIEIQGEINELVNCRVRMHRPLNIYASDGTKGTIGYEDGNWIPDITTKGKLCAKDSFTFKKGIHWIKIDDQIFITKPQNHETIKNIPEGIKIDLSTITRHAIV